MLRLLMRHGPLSPAGLHYILQPPIKKRRLREVLNRLTKQGLLYKRRSPQVNCSHYQINQHESAYKKLSEKLGLPAEAFHLPQFRHLQTFRTETHAVWTEKLGRIFPDAQAYRAHEISASVFKQIMPDAREYHPKHLPDVILHWCAKPNISALNVALLFELPSTNWTRIKK